MQTHPRERAAQCAKSLCTEPFLKWPGGKRLLADTIIELLPSGRRLIEPFVGAGALFARSAFNSYVVSDVNQDLSSLYEILRDSPVELLSCCASLFDAVAALPDVYYTRRVRFNALPFGVERAALFVYLNRFGFNGLCRYNRRGLFNVPVGRHSGTPTLPLEAMLQWSEKLQRAAILNGDFEAAITLAARGDVVFCDPPYASETGCFVGYAGNSFTWKDQIRVASCARSLARSGVPVLVTNHDLPKVRQLYKGADMVSLNVRRSIGRSAESRRIVSEVAALFT